MKKRRRLQARVLVLWGAGLVLPATIWPSVFYGPSGALAQAGVGDGANLDGFCTTGFIPSAAACDTGSIVGFSAAGDLFTGSASAVAGLAGGILNLKFGTSGADTAIAGAGAQINDTIFFHGLNGQEQTGILMVTATGIMTGDNTYINETLGVHYTHALYTNFGFAGFGPWTNAAFAQTNRPINVCSTPSDLPSTACSFTDGQSIALSVTFPLNEDGIYIELSMTGGSSGDGSADYADPVSLILPSGVTFTSASGEFLAGPGTASSPEPGSAWLLGFAMAGILGLESIRSRRKKT